MLSEQVQTDKEKHKVKSEPKYRKSLNKDQLSVLELLYEYRFGNSEHIARYFNKTSPKHIQKRLRILEDQKLIGKRYDSSYKLRGKPAAYYLQPKGARTMMHYSPPPDDEPLNVKGLYKNKTVSENFITYCLCIFGAYLSLRSTYGSKLSFFTKNDLNYKPYDYFPNPLPSAYLRLQTGTNEDDDKMFFLDVFLDNTPFFILIRRIKKYLQYAGSGDWVNKDIPTVLMACETNSTQKRLWKRLVRELNDSYEKVTFATTTISLLTNNPAKAKIWRKVEGHNWEDTELISLVEL